MDVWLKSWVKLLSTCLHLYFPFIKIPWFWAVLFVLSPTPKNKIGRREDRAKGRPFTTTYPTPSLGCGCQSFNPNYVPQCGGVEYLAGISYFQKELDLNIWLKLKIPTAKSKVQFFQPTSSNEYRIVFIVFIVFNSILYSLPVGCNAHYYRLKI